MTSPQSPYPHGGHGPGPSYYHQPPPVYGSSSPGPNPHYAYQYPPPPPPHHHSGPSRPNGRGGGPYNPRNQPHNPYVYYPPPFGHHPGPIPMQAPNPHPYPRNQPYSPSYAYLNPAAVPFTPPRHTPQPVSPNVTKQRPTIPEFAPAIPIVSPRAQKPAGPPPQPEPEAIPDQPGPPTTDEQGPSSHQMGSFPPTPEPTTDTPLATAEPTDPSLAITESTDASPPFSFATSEPTEPSPPISFAIWSRRPRDPSHAPGIIISPRACPPPKVVDEALDSKTPPISPRAAKKKLPSAVESRDTTTLRLDAVPHSQTSSTVPSSAVTESADTPTIPGSPATTNTSISTEAKPEVTPTPALENDSSAPSDEKKADDEAPSVPVPEPAAAPAAPPVKKSWASLLRSASSSASPGSSAKNALPTSSIVGFSIPADAPSAPPAQSVSPSRKTELLNLLMSPPSTAAFAPRIRPRGLVNSGNMCFANAVLQILVYCPPFHRLFVELGKVLPSVAVAGEREREKEREKEWAGLPSAASNATTTNGTSSSTSTPAPSSKPAASSTPLVDATALFLKEFLDKRKPKSKENGGFSRAGKGKERELLADDADDDWDTVDSFLPTYIYDAMKEKKRFDTMRGGQQEDAEEFLGFYLDTLEEELLLLLNSVAKSEASGEENSGEEKREEGWMEVGKKNRMVVTRTVKASESPITRIFGGKFRSTLHAPRQKDSAVVEDWRSLRLDIQPDNIHTIQDALAYISHPQHVQLNIPTQPVAVEATQIVSIESLPPILVLHIKRFEYDVKVGGVVKIGKQVRFEDELAIGGDLMAPAAKKTTGGPTRYKLFGVLYHHGLSASGGHYTLDVLHPNRYASLAVPTSAASAVSGAGALKPREGWIRIDDDLVSDVRHEDVFGASMQERDESRCAYLLFYRRL